MRGQLKKESEALQFGSLYDMLLFEPEKAHDTYYVLDDADVVASIGVNILAIQSGISGRQRLSRRRKARTRSSQVKTTGRKLTR